MYIGALLEAPTCSFPPHHNFAELSIVHRQLPIGEQNGVCIVPQITIHSTFISGLIVLPAMPAFSHCSSRYSVLF